MPNENDVNQIAHTAESMAESLLPALLPVDPLIKLLVTGIIRAHFNATRTWPSADEVKAALPVGWQKLQGTWDGYVPSGDGSLTA